MSVQTPLNPYPLVLLTKFTVVQSTAYFRVMKKRTDLRKLMGQRVLRLAHSPKDGVETL